MAKRKPAAKRPARKPSGRTVTGAPRQRAAPRGLTKRHVSPYKTKSGQQRRGYSRRPSGCSFMLVMCGLAALAGWLLS